MSVTLTVIDAPAFPAAADYYRMCATELLADSTTIPVSQGGMIQEVRNLTLDSLLDTILSAGLSPDDNIILVVHAREGGISLRLLNGASQRARQENLNLLSGDRSIGDISPILELTRNQVNGLRVKMNRVQQLGLSRLEIRGCNVGTMESTLRATKAFFLTQCVGGPSVRNAYVRTPVNIDANQNEFTRISRNSNGRVIDLTSGGSVGFVRVPRPEREHAFDLTNFKATSRAVFETWVRNNFPITGNIPEGSICLHAQYLADGLVFPKEANYIENLNEYCGAARASLDGIF